MRDYFPIFAEEKDKPLVYLDSAATSQKPREVIDAMSSFLSEGYGTVHRAIYSLAAGATERHNEVRETVRQFIGAGFREEIIFTRGTTESINLVATSFGKSFVEEGDEILVVETEHHSNIIPWQMLCKERKAVLRIIPVDDNGEISLETLAGILSSKVKLVAIAHVANATGVIHPIAEVIAIAHSHGSKVLVDAAQSIAHLPISVEEWDVDFLAFSGHKMYGPTGIGILYGKKELLEKMPPYQGGGDMVETVTFEKTTYQQLPLKFEAGTPSITEVMGLGAAIHFIQKIGFQKIQEIDHQLVDYAMARLSKIPGIIFLSQAKKRSSIISFNCEGCHPLDVGTLLDLRGIAVRTGHLCAQPALKRLGVTSTIRVSFALYNTVEEIDELILGLQQVMQVLR
ncbi:MAG: cysteine desulfurase [Chlamydiota bacterium]